MTAEQRRGEESQGEQRGGSEITMAMGAPSALCRLQMHLAWSLAGLVSRVSRAGE
jgi:hypothetical protein